jgi:hypothetical protein
MPVDGHFLHQTPVADSDHDGWYPKSDARLGHSFVQRAQRAVICRCYGGMQCITGPKTNDVSVGQPRGLDKMLFGDRKQRQ